MDLFIWRLHKGVFQENKPLLASRMLWVKASHVSKPRIRGMRGTTQGHEHWEVGLSGTVLYQCTCALLSTYKVAADP